jgi:hypothetical protein
MKDPNLAKKVALVSWTVSALCAGVAFLLAVVSQSILDPTPIARAICSRDPIAMLGWTARCIPVEMVVSGLPLLAGVKFEKFPKFSLRSFQLVSIISSITALVVVGVIVAFLVKMTDPV